MYTKEPLSMLPGIKDAKDGIQVILYNLGLRKNFPQMGRYNFEEKLEYWAFVWGAVVMGLTGFMMWNPIMTTRILPGEAIPAAKAAHGGEALLAVGAIIIWHMYSVHLKRFNKSMFTGKMNEEEMLHEHPLELADLKAGIAGPRVTDPKELRKRKSIYFPIAGVLSIIMLAGIYGFINLETTSLTTIPSGSNSIPAYLPQTPTPFISPTPTSLPATQTSFPTQSVSETDLGPLTWVNFVKPLIEQHCNNCHSSAVVDGEFYIVIIPRDDINGEQILSVLPGNSSESLLVTTLTEGRHYADFSADDIAKVIQWIDEGAKLE